jgi:nickel-dependent lactate racemase
MAEILLKYGRSEIPFEFDEDRFQIIKTPTKQHALSDIDVGKRLDSPIDSPPIEDVISPGETVLIVVPDATREAAAGQIVNLLIRRLIANGTTPFEISIIFATGIHRAVTQQEKEKIVTPFVAQRIKMLDHGCRDLMQLQHFGNTNAGIPVEVNRVLAKNDHVIIVGAVAFHYFAGFTGGRKLICPGLASSRTISATHKLAFDCEAKGRRFGVGPGVLDGNAVHEAFMQAAALIEPSFAVNSIVNELGQATEVFCGNWMTSHRKACEAFEADHTIDIKEKREIVIASCGGDPFDINLIQAHKTLDAVSESCVDGGTIVLLAECVDGLGRSDFLKWFDSNSDELAKKLCENYQVNGQSAWSLLKKAERFDVRIMTEVLDDDLRTMKLSRIKDLNELSAGNSGYIFPNGKVRVKIKK